MRYFLKWQAVCWSFYLVSLLTPRRTNPKRCSCSSEVRWFCSSASWSYNRPWLACMSTALNGARGQHSLQQPKSYARESKYFFRDYSLTGFLPPRETNLVAPVQAWIESNALQSGIESLLKSDVPALCVYMPEYFGTEESKAKFASTLRGLGNRENVHFELCRAPGRFAN